MGIFYNNIAHAKIGRSEPLSITKCNAKLLSSHFQKFCLQIHSTELFIGLFKLELKNNYLLYMRMKIFATFFFHIQKKFCSLNKIVLLDSQSI